VAQGVLKDRPFVNDSNTSPKSRSAEHARLHDEDDLQAGLEDSFPASDPLAIIQPNQDFPKTFNLENSAIPSEQVRQSERNIWNGTARLILGASLALCAVAALLLWIYFR
jgi:hypothetical protein